MLLWHNSLNYSWSLKCSCWKNSKNELKEQRHQDPGQRRWFYPGCNCLIWSLPSGRTNKFLHHSQTQTGCVRWLNCMSLCNKPGFGIWDRALPLWALLWPCLSEDFIIPHSELIGPSELFRSCHQDRPLNQRLMLMWRHEDKHAARARADIGSCHSDLTIYLLFWH